MSDNLLLNAVPVSESIIDYATIKDALNTEKKCWWNTRAGYIIKTQYDPSTRSYKEQNLPYNLTPEGIPIKFTSNEIKPN